METSIRTMEDHKINAQISHSIEAMEIDLEMDYSTIRMGTGETVENFPVLHRFERLIFHKKIHIAKQEVINPTTLPSADLTIGLRPVLHLTNKSSHKTIIRYHRMWFTSPQPTIRLKNYHIFAR